MAYISMITAPDGMIVMPSSVTDPMPVLALIANVRNDGTTVASALAIDHNGKLIVVGNSDATYGFMGDETEQPAE